MAQIIPPSLVLIVIADQLGKSVGDMYKAAFLPAFILVGIYLIAIMVLALVKPKWVSALPPEARIYRETSGASGYTSLGILTALSAIMGALVFVFYAEILKALGAKLDYAPPTDEKVVMLLMSAIVFALVVATLDKLLRLNLLSEIAKRVTFVLIPPLLLIFLVLGTIFLGVATPTEGGAMGAAGAMLLAFARKRLTLTLLRQGLDSSARLSIFVLFVLVGSTVFSLTFQAINGPHWVEELFRGLPGGVLGFLIFVNLMIFILGCFIDFFEIAFIILPLLLPVADKMGIDLIFFGVMIALNLQTSFLTPPFGFALFYLRSVAAKSDYTDKVTGARIPALKTGDIYRGSIAFVLPQVIMVVAVIVEPRIITSGLGEQKKLDVEKVNLNITAPDKENDEPPPTMK